MVIMVMNGGGVMKGADDSWQEHSGSSVHPGGERDSCEGDHTDEGGWGRGGGMVAGETDSWQKQSGSSVHPGGERDCSDGDQGDE